MSPTDRSAATILIVEDDENLRLALADNLEDEGYRVLTTARGGEVTEMVRQGDVDLVVLDIMLPDRDGYAVCRSLRAAGSETMILMLTARTLEDDLIHGFEAGADDYLTKPYRLAELLLRIKALLRRRGSSPSPVETFAGFCLNTESRTLTDPTGQPIALTRTEFDLLAFFLAHSGRALTRDQILDQVWGEEVIVDARTVDNFVSNLKKKMGWTPQAGFRIETLRGIGYRMEVDG